MVDWNLLIGQVPGIAGKRWAGMLSCCGPWGPRGEDVVRGASGEAHLHLESLVQNGGLVQWARENHAGFSAVDRTNLILLGEPPGSQGMGVGLGQVTSQESSSIQRTTWWSRQAAAWPWGRGDREGALEDSIPGGLAARVTSSFWVWVSRWIRCGCCRDKPVPQFTSEALAGFYGGEHARRSCPPGLPAPLAASAKPCRRLQTKTLYPRAPNTPSQPLCPAPVQGGLCQWGPLGVWASMPASSTALKEMINEHLSP